MIKELEIHNFKSIKDLTLPCKRFNIFIGEPNTGKSNILEALGLLSFIGVRQHHPEAKMDGFVRYERLSNLFYDDEGGDTLTVRADNLRLDFVFREGEYKGRILGQLRGIHSDRPNTLMEVSFSGSHSTIISVVMNREPDFTPRTPPPFHIPSEDPPPFHIPSEVKFYRFVAEEQCSPVMREFLLPPAGENLPSLLLQNRALRLSVNEHFFSRGLRLGIRPQENKLELVKSADDIIISYPYSMVSDTLKRITFYTAILETNKNSVIVLEEPEAHSFPGETKILAEQIAMDEYDNQYFIVTHNPYFLMPLLSKAPKDDVAINIVYSEDYQTKVRLLEDAELSELFEINIFANLGRYLEE